MESESSFLIPGGLFVLTVFFGFRLSGAGRPYNGILFNIHKLIALGMLVLTGVHLSNTVEDFVSYHLFTLLIYLGATAVLLLFVSGGLMSAGKLDHKLMLIVHRAGSITAVIAMALLVYSFFTTHRL
jgi:hypothetical protein